MENCINEACPIYGTTNVHNCRGGTEMMQACKKYIFLKGDLETGANVPLDLVVSQPIRAGKDYEMFCQFRKQVVEGGNPCISGPDFVVMTRDHYNEMIKAVRVG